MKLKRKPNNEVMGTGDEARSTQSQAAVTQAEPAAVISQRAYFLLGEGGSGVASVLARKRLMHLWGSAAIMGETVQCLVIDNDAKFKEHFGPREFIAWDEVPAGDFIRAKLANPERLPSLDRLGDLEQLLQELKPIELVKNGCRNNRRLGALIHAYEVELHGERLLSDLVTPILHLRRVASDEDDPTTQVDGAGEGNEYARPVIVSQIYSASGAKGNSAALPDLWLIQAQLRQMGIHNVRYDATIFLAETFKTTQQQRLQANTHAFLLELADSYCKDLPLLQLSRYTVARTPVYTLIKLCNGIDEQGRTYRQQDVHAIDAACWHLSSYGAVADHLESLIPNIIDQLKWPQIAYSQNCHTLVLPVRELQKLFALRLSHLFVRDELLRVPEPTQTAARGKQLAREWLSQQQLTLRDIAQLFQHSPDGQPLGIDLRPYQQLPLERLKVAIHAYESAKLKTLPVILTQLVKHHSERMSSSLQAQLAGLLNQADGGLAGAAAFLAADEQRQGVCHFIEALQTALQQKIRQTEAALTQQGKQLEQKENLLWRLFPKLFAQPRQRHYYALKAQHLALQYQRHLLYAEKALVEQLAQLCTRQLQLLDGMQIALEGAERLAVQQMEGYTQQRRQRPVYEENVLSPEEEEQLFQQSIAGALTLTRTALRWQWATNPTDPQAEQWALAVQTDSQPLVLTVERLTRPEGITAFAQSAQRCFTALEALEIEQVLISQGRDGLALMERMKSLASPLISIDWVAHKQQSGGQALPLRRELILGAPGGTSGFFSKLPNQDGLTIVATGAAGRHRVELLCSLFNINPFALTQSPAYKRAYDELRAQGYAPHIFDETEVITEEEEEHVTRRRRRSRGDS